MLAQLPTVTVTVTTMMMMMMMMMTVEMMMDKKACAVIDCMEEYQDEHR